jgi:hypothetical protein
VLLCVAEHTDGWVTVDSGCPFAAPEHPWTPATVCEGKEDLIKKVTEALDSEAASFLLVFEMSEFANLRPGLLAPFGARNHILFMNLA